MRASGAVVNNVGEMDDLSERRLEKRRQELLGEFRTWLVTAEPTSPVAELADDAETFLQWDSNYGDSRFTQFDPLDIDEYLLRWCPRKLSFPPSEWMGVVDGLVAYLDFLAATGRWTGSAKQATAVTAHARARAEAFLDAMADPTNFGMAKGMLMGPAFSGADVDFNDPDSLQAAMDRYNNLPFEERKALTDPYMTSRPDAHEAELRAARAAFDMPPVRMPSDEEAARSAAASPLLAAVTGLRQYLQPKGVVLTPAGNFKLVDCRALVELLNTGDPGQARSMNDLRNLAFIFDVALMARATQILGSRIHAAADWPDDATVAATQLATMALDFETNLEIDSWYDAIRPTVAAGFPYLIAPALGYGVALTIDEMLPLAVGAVLSAPQPMWVTEDTARTIVLRTLKGLMQTMALAGVITFVDDTVAMTPFGTRFMMQYMLDQGFHVTERPPLHSLTAEQLLATITDANVLAAEQAWADWQPGWSHEQRATALVDALSEVPYELRTAHQRYGAFALLSVPPTTVVEPQLRRLLGGPYSGYALTELATRGLQVTDGATDDELDQLSDVLGVMLPWIDQCALDITIDGAGAVVEAVDELVANVGMEVLQTLSRLPVAEAADVLRAVGSAHPSKKIAKLARTELHRWRSRWGH